MQKTALLSYLLYEDGKITIDEIEYADGFWGDGFEGNGKNKLGNCLNKLRKYFYINN